MTTTTSREIERKYVLAPGTPLPMLGGVSGVDAVTEPNAFTQEAIYFDTPGLRLASNSITLRRRTGGTDDGWHLKLPAAGGRDEITVPLGSAGNEPPADLADLVQAFTRGEPLSPVGRIVTHRAARLLKAEDGTALAEVVIDDVSAQTLGESTTLTTWSEAEVELVGGDPGLLDEIEDVLAAAGIQRAASPSKLAQLLGDRLPSPPPKAAKRSSAGEVAVAYLREQLQTLLAYDPRVRRDEDDAVHKMRVATRRTRSTLKTFGPLFADPDRLTALGEELRWIGAELGAVRDLDVLPATLAAALAGVPDELIVGPVHARIAARTAHDRAAARTELLAALNSDRYFALLSEFESLAADPPFVPAAGDPGAHGLPRLIRRTYRRVARRVTTALEADPGPHRDEAIHEARKAAKRARYAGEATAPTFGKLARAYAARMQELQELLGEHQDTVVARQVLRQLGMQAQLAGENAFTYGLLYGLAAGRATAAEQALPALWHAHSDDKLRGWFS
ncbi:MAG: hypothetical protein JWO79_4484 [Actinomycetia bacterium]|nr:hypothetical protein [Actinomycetes bacterium]